MAQNIEDTRKAIATVLEMNESIHSLAESIINLLSVIDTPVGRLKLGVDLNAEKDNHSTIAVQEAKKTLQDMENKQMLTQEFINQYASFWRII